MMGARHRISSKSPLASASAKARSSRLTHIDSLDIVHLDQLSDNGVVAMTKRMEA
jgi:hypothetical protein